MGVARFVSESVERLASAKRDQWGDGSPKGVASSPGSLLAGKASGACSFLARARIGERGDPAVSTEFSFSQEEYQLSQLRKLPRNLQCVTGRSNIYQSNLLRDLIEYY